MVSPPLPRNCHASSHSSKASVWVCPGTEVRFPPDRCSPQSSPPRPPGRQMERAKARVRPEPVPSRTILKPMGDDKLSFTHCPEMTCPSLSKRVLCNPRTNSRSKQNTLSMVSILAPLSATVSSNAFTRKGLPGDACLCGSTLS